jgi:hypothetical protein
MNKGGIEGPKDLDKSASKRRAFRNLKNPRLGIETKIDLTVFILL